MYVTLSISSSDIRFLAMKGRRVKKWGSMPLEPGLVRDGDILNPQKVGRAISDLFQSMEIPRENVIASVTGLSFTYRTLSLPRMKSAITSEAIYRAAAKEMPLPLDELYLSWQVTSREGDEVSYFVLGVPRNLIDAVKETLVEAGIRSYLIDLKPLALTRAANQADGLIAALEADCFDIILVARGIPIIMHTITPREGGASLEDNVRRLVDGLSKTIEFHNSTHPENPLNPQTPLFLAGQLMVDTGILEILRTQIEYPVEILTPPIEFPPHLPVALYATNMGLALREVSPKTVTRFREMSFKVLPDKRKAKAKTMPWRYLFPALALLVIGALLLPLYQMRKGAVAETTALRAELTGISQELRLAREAADKARQEEEEIKAAIEEVTAEIAALEEERLDILGDVGDFTVNLEVVSQASSSVPSWLAVTSIGIGEGQIIVEGEAEDPFSVVGYVTSLEAQGDFSEVRIAEIGEGDGSSGVSFRLFITL